MTPSEQIARFLTQAPTGQDVTLPIPGGKTTLPDLFPEHLDIACERCGVAACWRRALCPPDAVRTFARIVYHCPTCRGDAGFYLLARWVADRSALLIRKVAQYLPTGRAGRAGR